MGIQTWPYRRYVTTLNERYIMDPHVLYATKDEESVWILSELFIIYY